ncbi:MULTISPECIES: PspC domain-containing protein [Allokutzneria]|uniref:Phage shock protein PspC N-terminal domain-containing protein n=1 Tax=Allokutzneria multivorans TaxID=1142134 RepID=A0ABP7R7H2_9PSEU|nr:PspC domain-containing protein [Allokutzneria sp. NRRL B-24872]
MFDTDTTTQSGSSVRRFRRSRTDRMVAGVCGGVARVLNVDAALLRILLVAATLLGFGAGAVLYLVCWILMPEDA